MGRPIDRIRSRTARRRWFAASSLAMATAMLHPLPLAAQTTTTQGQAVLGRATYNTGDATYTPGAAVDLVTVQTTDLLINWTPDDTATGGGPISFLPAGNGLFFTFDGSNYTVVNRILPTDATRAVRFDGQVASFVNGFGSIGGNIYFYSPGGIIVGGTGRFDVGSLVLTTSDITAAGSTLGFAASNPGSFVRIEPWAATAAGDVTDQIQLINQGSYLALVAPRVEQHGRVNVDGSIAYVAAESATLTINNGLFNIVIGAGTDDENGIVHTGITGGPSSSGVGDNQRTYLTAISKNDAITMLVGGQIGYAQAAQAGVVNGSIQLLAQTQNPAGGGNIEVGPTAFTSDVLIAASDRVSLTADGIGNNITFGSVTGAVNASIFALNQIDLNATSGGNVFVFGDLTMYAGNFTTGGIINITVDDVGRNDDAILNGLVVLGNFSAGVNAVGTNTAAPGGVGGDAVGGTINVDVNTGGDIFLFGNAVFNASAQAGFGLAQAGTATGGAVNIAMTGANSRLAVQADTTINTGARPALNPFDGLPDGSEGGASAGGDVSLSLRDGRSQFGNLTIDTAARGTSGTDSSIAQDNAASAGNVAIEFAGRTHDILGTLAIDSRSSPGLSFDSAGSAIGGTSGRAIVNVGIDGAAVTVGGISIDASTEGDISAAAPADAITFAAINGATFLTASFDANAGHNNRESAADSQAGSIVVSADGASLELGDVFLSTDNSTFASGVAQASNKRAGDISLIASGGGSIAGGFLFIGARSNGGETPVVGAAEHVGGDVVLLADGGTMTFGSAFVDTSVEVPAGGDMTGLVSTGGNILLQQVNAGAGMTFDDLFLSSGAFGSSSAGEFSGDGGNAAAGDVTIDVQAGAFVSNFLSIDASAFGQAGGDQIANAGDTAGRGGSAQAGDVNLIAAGDSFSPGFVSISTSAIGGNGGVGEASLGAGGAGAGGAATGGSVNIQALAGTFDIDNFGFFDILAVGPSPIPLGAFVIDASATGGAGGFGNGTAGGDGGDATGGTAIVTIDGGTVNFAAPTLALVASATGGAGGDTGFDFGTGLDGGPGGAGGSATGGTASYAITAGTTNLGTVILDASASGGAGGTSMGSSGAPVSPGGAGGDALGGSTSVTLGVDDGSDATFVLNSTGGGGAGGGGASGGAGGLGHGGGALFTVADAAVNLGSLSLDTSGLGGTGGVPSGAGGTGGDGGDGIGGSATIDVFGLGGALSSDSDVEITSTGEGGAGAGGGYYFGSADGGPGGAGGSGTGGAIALIGRDGATFSLSTTGFVDARGLGGAGGVGGYSYDGNGGAGGDGGDAFGGSISLSATGAGTLDVASSADATTLAASAIGGLGGDGGQQQLSGTTADPGGNGAGTGGAVGFLAAGAGSNLVFRGDVIADATALGAADTRQNSTGADAAGGAITVDVAGGGALAVAGNLNLNAGALATIGTLSLGNAVGGTVNLTMAGGGSAIDIDNGLTIEVSAFDGRTGDFEFQSATGGDATAGAVALVLDDGTLAVAGDLLISAMAGYVPTEGGSRGGTATGGDVGIVNDGAAVLTLDDVIINTFAQGGDGSTVVSGAPGDGGGNAIGGNVLVSNLGAGSFSANSISIDSGAAGGQGGFGDGGGAGGNGTAGSATIANGSDFAVQDLTVVAIGIGGHGGGAGPGFAAGVGGQGTGGAISLSTSTTIAGLGSLTLEAIGTGGIGGTSMVDSTTGGGGSQGGDGIGGSVSIELTGAGTVLPDIADFGVNVTGYGGEGGDGSQGDLVGGAGGAGGAGTGGTLTLASRTGAAIDLTSLSSTLSANGVGGAGGDGGSGAEIFSTSIGGTGGDGGFGTGGTLNLIAQGGAIVADDIELTATGNGGDAGVGGMGYYSLAPGGANGSGAGGLVTLQALEGSPGEITLGSAVIDASGFAGGGDISVPTAGGSIEITDASTDPAGLITMGSLTATALGAVRPAGASFTMSGDSGPITVTGNTTVDVIGDIAFIFADTGRLAVGGATTLNAGGDITVTHTDNATNVTTIASTGDFNAAAGGDFFAGAGTAVSSGAALSITAQNISYEALSAGTSLTLNAVNGNIAGILGLVSGGAIDLDATGSISIFDADAEDGFTADAGGDVSFNTIVNSNNNLRINAGENIVGGSASTLAPSGSSGNDSVQLTAGGAVTLTGSSSAENNYTVLAGGAISGGDIAAGDILSLDGAAIAVGNLAASSATLTAAGDASFADAVLAGGDIEVIAGGSISAGDVAGASGIDLQAGTDIVAGTLAASGPITGSADGTLTVQSALAGDALDLRAGSTLTIADAIGGTVALRSTDGAVIVTRDIESTFSGDAQLAIVSGAAVQIDDINDVNLTLVQATNGDIDVVAAGDIGIVAAESVGDINLTSTGGDVRVTLAEAGKAGIVPAATSGGIGPAGTDVGNPGAGDIAVNAAGLAQGTFVASAGIAIAAGTTIDLNGADAGGSISLGSGGSTRVFGTAAAGSDITIQSGGDVRVANSAASLEAGGALAIDAQGVFDTQGFAYGASVSVTARDVVIGSAGQVGDGALTQSITFTSNGAPVFVGGAAEAGAFSLDADEFGRIRGRGDLSIFARSGGQQANSGDIVARDLEVLAGSGGSIGNEGTLLLDAQGRISVTGALGLTAGTGDSHLALRAGNLVWIDTAGGNLRVENAGGDPVGFIDVSAGRFVAASAAALAAIEGLSAAAIDARLAQNDGVTRPEGFLQAGTLRVQAQSQFLVQNSGEGDDFDERRGFTVDVLSIETSEGPGPLLVINGTIGGATGVDAIAAASFPSGLDAASTLNGCLIANPASCTSEPPPSDRIEFTDPARDLIERDFEPGIDAESLDGALESQLIDLSPPEEFEDDPLIDDPVTGAGNEDLWIGEPECEPGEEEEGLCPVGEAEAGNEADPTG